MLRRTIVNLDDMGWNDEGSNQFGTSEGGSLWGELPDIPMKNVKRAPCVAKPVPHVNGMLLLKDVPRVDVGRTIVMITRAQFFVDGYIAVVQGMRVFTTFDQRVASYANIVFDDLAPKSQKMYRYYLKRIAKAVDPLDRDAVIQYCRARTHDVRVGMYKAVEKIDKGCPRRGAYLGAHRKKTQDFRDEQVMSTNDQKNWVGWSTLYQACQRARVVNIKVGKAKRAEVITDLAYITKPLIEQL